MYKKGFLYFSICLISCNRYIDQSKISTFSDTNSIISFQSNNNLLNYKSKVVYKSDTDTIKQKLFSVLLPKGIINYKLILPNIFYIKYSKKQVILINSGFVGYEKQKDTSFGFLNTLFFDKTFRDYFPFIPEIYSSLKKIKKSRKHILIRSQGISFLFLNIKPTNYKKFTDNLSTLHIY